MFRPIQSLGATSALLALALGVGSANGASITSIDVVLDVDSGAGFPYDPPPPVVLDTGNFVGDYAQQTLNHSSGGSTANATFFVEDGSLHASVYVFGAVGSQSSGVGTASVQLFFGDSLVLTSSTLAPGTEVSYQVTLAPTYTLSTSKGGCDFGFPPSFGLASFQAVLGGGLLQGGSFNMVDGTCDRNDVFGPMTATFTGIIGQEYTISTGLYVTATGIQGQSAGVNALNTSKFFIDPLGDFAYETASGNTYFSPTSVPEPSTWILLLGGVVLGARMRRRPVS